MPCASLREVRVRALCEPRPDTAILETLKRSGEMIGPSSFSLKRLPIAAGWSSHAQAVKC